MKKTVRELRPGDRVLLTEMPEKGIIIYNEIYNEKSVVTVVTSTENGMVTTMDSDAIFSTRSQHTVEVSTNREYILWSDPGEFLEGFWKFIKADSDSMEIDRLLGYLGRYSELEKEYEKEME